MKFSKKHVILGIICLISALLQNLSGVGMFIPYLTFCLCSFVVGVKRKKGIGIFTVLLFGLIALPVFDFIYSMLTASLMTTLFAHVLILLVQACVYFALFILVNSWVNKEKISFSLITSILAIFCVVVYSILEGSQIMAFSNALNQAVEQGALVNWLNVMVSKNIFVNILSKAVFYIALWCTSTRFIKEK